MKVGRRFRGFIASMAVGAVVVSAPAGVRGAESDPGVQYQWALKIVGAQSAWDAGASGKGIVVAVIDSGVDLDHEDLEPNLVVGRDFVEPGTKPQDDEGGGTHVAGIIAAVRGNGRGIAGLAPGAKVMPIKAIEDDRSATTANLADAIRYAADQGAAVIDVSLEGDFVFDLAPITNAVRYAWSKGSIPVLSAGHETLLARGFSDEPAIVVTGTTRSDGVPRYSGGVGAAQWGMAAPGGAGAGMDEDDVFSTFWPHTEARGAREYGRYAYRAGNNMAAAHVAGGAALLRGLGLSPERTVQRLLETARDVGDKGRDAQFGAGVLDLSKAVRGLERPAPTTTTTAPLPPEVPTTTSTTSPTPRSTQTSAADPPPTVLTTEIQRSTTSTTAHEVAGASSPPDEGGDTGAPTGTLVLIPVAAAVGLGWFFRERLFDLVRRARI